MISNNKNTTKKRVLVAMSGGVDSSVAAYILKKQGYDLIGVHMKFWTEKEGSDSGHLTAKDNKCCSIEGVEDARNLCDQLEIPFYVLNFKDDFKDNIVNYFVESFKLGLTPNPCVMCNRNIKFGLLYDKMKDFNADYVATGHYARISKINNDYYLSRSRDLSKDQSYFLHGIKKDVLSKTLFPIGEIESKDEVRKIALDAKLRVSAKKDSQEICFIPGNDYKGFIQRNVKTDCSNGDIIDLEGNIIGKHIGLSYYTIGQRKGIETSLNKPLYVIKKNFRDNTLIVGDIEDCKTYNIVLSDINILKDDQIGKNTKIQVRYRGKILDIDNYKIIKNNMNIALKDGDIGIAPGQFGVLYNNDTVIGGGVISI
jgi:tRNA-specific 2-thiouridylase